MRIRNTDIKPNSKIITFNSDETEDASVVDRSGLI